MSIWQEKPDQKAKLKRVIHWNPEKNQIYKRFKYGEGAVNNPIGKPLCVIILEGKRKRLNIQALLSTLPFAPILRLGMMRMLDI